MLESIWQAGILTAALVFGIQIGLACGFAGISKKTAALIAVGYGVGVIALSVIASGYSDIVYKIVYEYNFVIFLAMSIEIMYAGLRTLQEWKIHHKNKTSATSISMIGPCPACFGAVLSAVILASPAIGTSTLVLGQYAAVFLAASIVIFYLLAGVIVRIVKKPYPILLGNFMLFVGLYFLVSAIVIPNIASVLTTQFHPLTIPAVSTFIYACLAVVALLVVGVYTSRKYSSLVH